MVDKQRSEEMRARKAEALRANLRKRKAATRKLKQKAEVSPPKSKES